MSPALAPTVTETRAAVLAARAAGQRVGLVPTMGALHAGHASLIRAARVECEFNVVSIFVNPTQFGPNEDFARYPRTFEADCELCAVAGADLVFAPSVAEMYPPNSRTSVDVAGMDDVLCGRSRPGHFRGVATVVMKLLQIVQPDVAFFGQKDAQQAIVIQRMVADLNLPAVIRIQPTVRDVDGLALSSRNRYLDPTQRLHATCLVRALRRVEELFGAGERSTTALEHAMSDVVVNTPGARLDYAEIRDAQTLAAVAIVDRPVLAALAVYFGTTRLIDNSILSPGRTGQGA